MVGAPEDVDGGGALHAEDAEAEVRRRPNQRSKLGARRQGDAPFACGRQGGGDESCWLHELRRRRLGHGRRGRGSKSTSKLGRRSRRERVSIRGT